MADNTMEPLAPFAVSATEAARLLGISKPTMYTLMERADFPRFKVGTRVLIPVDGLREWVRRQSEAVS